MGVIWSLSPIVANGAFAWFDVKIGGGGFQRSMDIHADGTIVTQTDVYGGYIGKTVVDTVFQQLITKTSLPASYSSTINPYQGGGIVTLRFAPSNSSIIYMIYTPYLTQNSTVMVSQDKGVTWKETNFGTFTATPNDGSNFINFCQHRIAVDPLNPAICFVGTQLIGMWKTTNGLSATPTWVQMNANSFPTTGTDPGVAAMQFDPTSGSGGVTQRLIVGVAGSGLWVTANGGTTWTKITGSPTNPGKGSIGSDGNYYCTQTDGAKVWRLSTANVLTDITPGTDGYYNIAIDPNNPARGVTGGFGGTLNLCTSAINTGTPTWAGVSFNSQLNANANQPAWQAAVNDNFLSAGMLMFDPLVTTSSTSRTIGTGSFSFTVGTGLNIVVGDLMRFFQTGTPTNFILGAVTAYNSGTGAITITETSNGGSGTIASWTVTKDRLWFSWGCGVSYTDVIATFPGTQQWQIQFAGIENLVANQVVWPPNGNPFAACWDRPFWNLVNPNAYPTGYHPAYPTGLSNRVIFGSSVDWAKSTPTFIVGLSDDASSGPPIKSGYSTDSGVTWIPFASQPPSFSGGPNGGAGTIAACDTNRIVIVKNDDTGIFQTQHGGATWQPSPATISSAAYNSTTGLVTLTLSAAITLGAAPDRIVISGATGSKYTISSGTYSNTTGVVSLTLSGAASFNNGKQVTVSGLTGTGAFASINGAWTSTVVSGTNVQFNAGAGLTASTITGGSLSIAENLNGTFISASVSGTTVTYTGPTGLGTLSLTGGSLAGTTWSQASGAPTTGWGASGFNSSNYRVAADCVNIGTFYAWNDGGGANNGMWKSTDGGQSWTQSWAGTMVNDNSFLVLIRTVPNLGSTSTAGHIFLTGGPGADLGTTHPVNVPFLRWTNGGTGTPTTVANVLEVITFGFGAPKPGNSYPAIYIVGWVTQNGGVSYQYGVWRSDDNCVSWNFIVDFPPRTDIDPSGGGWLDSVKTIEGNPNRWNSCIVGFTGSSFVRYGPASGY